MNLKLFSANILKWLFIQTNSRVNKEKNFSGDINVSNIKENISIIRDNWNIPHMSSKNKNDLFFAQGFVHAQDRLWQLEMSRRIAMGNLSEAFGEIALPTDRLTRTLGFNRLAYQDINLINSENLSFLQSFSDGINFYIENYPKPVEFFLTRIKPKKWEPIHSVAWGRVMSWTLSHGWSGALTRQQIIDKVGIDLAEELNIIYPEKNPIELPNGFEFNKLSLDGMYESITGPFLYKDMEGGGRGSNAWAVSAKKSISGAPILCNDTHLPIQIPSVWYINHLKSKNYHTIGATMPGLPGIIIGHNEKISIGITLSFLDNEDIFIEKISDKNDNKYIYNNEEIDFKIIEETIKIKNKKDHIEKIRITKHGPLIGGVTDHGKINISLCSQALQTNQMINGLFKLNHAQNWDEFVEACNILDSPPLNFVYADIYNNIGLWVTGKMPIRKNGEGQLPVPGWTDKFEWTDNIPPKNMPHLLNPKSGYIISCNNKITNKDYPYFLSHSFMNGYRAKRIEDVIKSKNIITFNDCKNLHTDFYSIPGTLILNGLLKNFKSAKPKVEKVLNAIIDWDGYLDSESIGGTVYQVFSYTLIRNIVEPKLGKSLCDKYLGKGEHPLLLPTSELLGHSIPALIKILQNGKSKWIKDSKSLIKIIEKSLSDTCEWLEKNIDYKEENWKWGKIHSISFKHGITLGQELLSLIFNIGPFPIGGDTDTVCQTAFNPVTPYKATEWCPAIRFIIDLNDFDNSLAILPPGQSGVLGSKHYDDMLQPWLKGEYVPLYWSEDKIENNKKYKLIFKAVNNG